MSPLHATATPAINFHIRIHTITIKSICDTSEYVEQTGLTCCSRVSIYNFIRYDDSPSNDILHPLILLLHHRSTQINMSVKDDAAKKESYEEHDTNRVNETNECHAECQSDFCKHIFLRLHTLLHGFDDSIHFCSLCARQIV